MGFWALPPADSRGRGRGGSEGGGGGGSGGEGDERGGGSSDELASVHRIAADLASFDEATFAAKLTSMLPEGAHLEITPLSATRRVRASHRLRTS